MTAVRLKKPRYRAYRSPRDGSMWVIEKQRTWTGGWFRVDSVFTKEQAQSLLDELANQEFIYPRIKGEQP